MTDTPDKSVFRHRRGAAYPAQLIVMLDEETADRIARESKGREPGSVDRRQGKSAVARQYIELGMRAHDAGFGRTPGGEAA